jgi:hypothetical protein
MRSAVAGLGRYIATVDTSRHRIFIFINEHVLCDDKVVICSSSDAFHLGVMSSRIHCTWANKSGVRLGVGNDPVYASNRCFDPFPFPSPGELLTAQIRTAAEELDHFRKERHKEHPTLTLTQMYNVLEKLKTIEAAKKGGDGQGGLPPLTEDEERIKEQGLILILQELHDRLDRLVFRAYGWPETLGDEEILARVVALNHDRTVEERSGHVRWLRPDYQTPRYGKDIDKQAAKEEGAQIVADLGLPGAAARKPSFPLDAISQSAAIFAALATAGGPTDAMTIASQFRRTKNLEETISSVLASLARLGHVVTKDGKTFDIQRVA